MGYGPLCCQWRHIGGRYAAAKGITLWGNFSINAVLDIPVQDGLIGIGIAEADEKVPHEGGARSARGMPL